MFHSTTPRIKSAFLTIIFINLLVINGNSAGIVEWTKLAEDLKNVIPFLPFENQTRCYGEIGCLNITRDMYGLNQPIHIFPSPRSLLNVKFILYTRENPKTGQLLNVNSNGSIESSNFDPGKPTKIIIYGMMDSKRASWIKDLTYELLLHDDYNVIVIDDDLAALDKNYLRQSANARLVGMEIAYFINYLKDHYGLNPTDVHIIGHSIGAHVAGYAGNLVNKIGRITGLEPAITFYHGLVDPAMRLDPSDADFVDVMHTNGMQALLLGSGLPEPVGHVDFYVNNGKTQPGCNTHELAPALLSAMKKGGIREALTELMSCNHIRSARVFVETINSSPCSYIARRCSSYELFKQGQCFSCQENSSCVLMGFHADRSRDTLVPGGRYFIETGQSSPYCRQHYKVTLELSFPSIAETWLLGSLDIIVHKENGTSVEFDLTPDGNIVLGHGTSSSFTVTYPEDLGNITKIELSWKRGFDITQPRFMCFIFCNDHLYVHSVEIVASDFVASLNNGDSRPTTNNKLCADAAEDYADIASGSTATFANQCDI